MPLIIVAIVLVAVILIMRAERTGKGPIAKNPISMITKPCRWKPVGFRSSETSTRWVCSKCNQEVFSTDGKAPKLCKRDTRSSSL